MKRHSAGEEGKPAPIPASNSPGLETRQRLDSVRNVQRVPQPVASSRAAENMPAVMRSEKMDARKMRAERAARTETRHKYREAGAGRQAVAAAAPAVFTQ